MKIKIKLENIVLNLAIITTVLSFSSNNTVSRVCSIIMYLFWAIIIVFKIMHQTLKVNTFFKTMIIGYIVWYLFTKLFYMLNFYSSGGMGVASYLRHCMIFYVIGLNYGNDDIKAIRKIIVSFFIGQWLLMITLLPELSRLVSDFYFNSAKNQTGQMLGIGSMLALFILPEFYNNVLVKLALMFSGVVSFIALVLLHSRTPIVALIVIGVLLFLQKKNKNIKDYAKVVIIFIVLVNIINQLGGLEYLLEPKGSTANVNLNTVTSGRIDLYKIAIRDFINNPVWGIGAYAYIDNFILNILRSGGILLAILLFPLSYGKFISLYRKSTRILQKSELNDESVYMLFTLTKYMIVFYCVISLMEGYPPLGPGTSVFFMWIMLGIADNMIKRKGLLYEE